ncbi:MAG: hypothetical protein QME14_05880 [Methanobacteriaceae archaeon]|nr:hypothetical protein [Methanobacteriaceae archaeon]
MKITKDYVKATSKCSCSLSSDYKYHEEYFKNYCPNCHLYGTINFEQGIGDHNPEGMWYCKNCDIDFCLVHGKSHDHRNLFLIKIENIDRFEKINHENLYTFKFHEKLKWLNMKSDDKFNKALANKIQYQENKK